METARWRAALCILVLLALSFTFPAMDGSAKETGTIDILAGDSRSVSFGSLYVGMKVSYTWTASDVYSALDFFISDNLENTYQEVFATYQGSNTFIVPKNGTFSMNWVCRNEIDYATVQYSYTIIEPPVVASLSVEHFLTRSTCPQNESTSLGVVIVNPNDGIVKIERIGAHFDWQGPKELLTANLSGAESLIIVTFQNFSASIPIFVGEDGSTGVHYYNINISYQVMAYNSWHPRFWENIETLYLNVTGKDTDHDGAPDKTDAFPRDPKEQKDSDRDEAGDNSDAFPEDPAASKDSDGDGSPDRWNAGMSGLNSSTGLYLDAFPNDPAASVDSDIDGYPDAWNTGMDARNSTTGLSLDEYPNDPYRWMDKKKSYTGLILIAIGIIVGIILAVAVTLLVMKQMKSSQKDAEKEAERIRLDMEEHQREKELELSGGRAESSASNVKVLTPGEQNLSIVPTTPMEAHAHDLDGKPLTYEELYGKMPEEKHEEEEEMEEVEEVEEETGNSEKVPPTPGS